MASSAVVRSVGPVAAPLAVVPPGAAVVPAPPLVQALIASTSKASSNVQRLVTGSPFRAEVGVDPGAGAAGRRTVRHPQEPSTAAPQCDLVRRVVIMEAATA